MISITLDETVESGDSDDQRPNIADCHTDIEDLDGDREKRNSLASSLKSNSKCNGAVTDVEDMTGSGDDFDEPELKYPDIDLSEMLDQGCTDEASNTKGECGNKDKKLISMKSISKAPSPTAFLLGVQQVDQGGVTDLEDVEGSGDDDDEKVYSDDDRAIVLEDSNGVDIHDSVSACKKSEKHLPRVMEPSNTSSSSESECEKPKTRLKAYKHFTKKSQKCSEAKSDVENIFMSDDEKSKSRQKSSPVFQTPDLEVVAFDGSVQEGTNDNNFPEINISFVNEEKSKKKKKKTYRSTPAPSPMLSLPQNQEEGHTDVENLNSSEDDDKQNVKQRPKSLIPIAVNKNDALTDVEDFGEASEDDCELNERPDIPLPSPLREFTVFVENNNGEPVKQSKPLPDNVLLGFQDFDADKGLTDVEDFSDEDDQDDYDTPKYEIDCMPEFDGGVVESSDHHRSRQGSLTFGATPEPITDTEDIFVKRGGKSSECRRRRTKPKHSQHKTKSNFLDTKFYDDINAGGANTDVEDLDLGEDDALLKDKSSKHNRSVEGMQRKMSHNDGKTDVEYMSGDDFLDLLTFSPDLSPNLSEYQLDTFSVTTEIGHNGERSCSRLEINFPEIRKISPTPEGHSGVTDTEDLNCNSENENESDSFSRAHTETPNELNCNLDESYTSEIHEIHSGAFGREFAEVKHNLCLNECITDVENFDDN